MIRPLPATLVLGFGTVVTHGFGLSLVPAMLPGIAADFAVGYGVLGGVTAVGLVAYSLGALGASRLVDRVPGRELLVGTYALCALALLGAGASTSPATLAAAVAVLGVAAPVSWAVTLHIAGVSVPVQARSAVMAGASSGAALGVLINGVLVQTSSTLHSWRVSFLVAAVLGALAVGGGLAVIRRPVPRPERLDRAAARAGYRQMATTRAGRVAVGAGIAVGVAGFPFAVFLTATAIDELGVSAWSTALLWWLIGGVGTLAGPVFGRYGDRTTPLQSLTVGVVIYAAGLALLAASWSYAGLLVAALGYAVMDYPIWGLVGSVANRHFAPGVAVRAISVGLIGAALGGAAGSALSGRWIDAAGSFRMPAAVMAAIMLVMSVWLVAITRTGGLEGQPGNGAPSRTGPATVAD